MSFLTIRLALRSSAAATATGSIIISCATTVSGAAFCQCSTRLGAAATIHHRRHNNNNSSSSVILNLKLSMLQQWITFLHYECIVMMTAAKKTKKNESMLPRPKPTAALHG
jgi:hypothetical protein